jgi:chaperonin GroEL (HSP60 family)
LNKEAKTSVRKGINFVYDCVRLTLGSGGRNAILGKEFGSPVIPMTVFLLLGRLRSKMRLSS